MVTTNTIIGSLLAIYNDSAKLVDPIDNRVGSFFFGPNQEVVERYKAPKGQITGGQDFSDTWSFGRPKIRDKHFNIHVAFFTPGNVVDRNGRKNEELVYDYLEKIEAVTMAYENNIGNVVMEVSEVEEEPFFLPDSNVYGGRRMFVFKERR